MENKPLEMDKIKKDGVKNLAMKAINKGTATMQQLETLTSGTVTYIKLNDEEQKTNNSKESVIDAFKNFLNGNKSQHKTRDEQDEGR